MTIKNLTLTSLGYIYFYRSQLFKALLIPFLVILTLDVLTLFISNYYFLTIFIIFSLMLQILIAITTHRIILLGPEYVPQWGILKWSRRETMFTFYLLALLFMPSPMIAFRFFPIMPIVSNILLILGIVFLLIIMPRLSLVFPAISIGDSYSFKKSWGLSTGFLKLMFFSVIVVPSIVSIPIRMLSTVPYTSLINSVSSSLTTIAVVTTLSVTYKYISESNNAS